MELRPPPALRARDPPQAADQCVQAEFEFLFDVVLREVRGGACEHRELARVERVVSRRRSLVVGERAWMILRDENDAIAHAMG